MSCNSSINRHYIDEVGYEVLINLQIDLTSATVNQLKVKKPDGTIVTWNASIYSVGSLPYYLRYITVAGDLDQPGKYEVQPYITIAGWSGYKDTSYFVIQSLFS